MEIFDYREKSLRSLPGIFQIIAKKTPSSDGVSSYLSDQGSAQEIVRALPGEICLSLRV